MTTTVRVLTLSDQFFIDYGDRDHISGLKDAILDAQFHEEQYGLPTCDYVKYSEYDENETIQDRYKKKIKEYARKMHVLRLMNKYSFDQFKASI